MRNEPETTGPAIGTVTQNAPKYLHVIVDGTDPKDGEPIHVNVRLPIGLIRVGIRFANFIPASARQQVNEELRKQGMDVDVNQISPEDLRELIDNLKDLTVDVDRQDTKVKVSIYTE